MTLSTALKRRPLPSDLILFCLYFLLSRLVESRNLCMKWRFFSDSYQFNFSLQLINVDAIPEHVDAG